MADENIGNTDGPEEEHQPLPEVNNGKPRVKMGVVGYNLLALAGYTILCRLLVDQGGIIFDALFLACHVFICLILSIGNKSWMWLLSGVLVLVIGFSTCVTIMGTGGIG
jgi:hypothetical protein